MKFLIQLLVNALAVVIIARLLPGVEVDTLSTGVWVALILSFLNFLIKPLLIFFTLPITILTLGLFLLVINAFIIKTAAYFTNGFTVNGILSALFFSLLLSVLQSFLSSFLGLKDTKKG